ncbi:conserved hypothetical protein [Neospora caninum Liverpool]|uniref:Transmembrane protein n=1 Tax=Neospora caninum (strain Liverpool) TaxID=572307 RepID=F0VAB8_NEOCL|nr:conserved hypothetical protein [Neospora caninum Liverpool]CBZ50607.1 conserved hypothetical protein [Neospora caninum Liverpool]|eukprot:XP_003880640.1 conserved hypothetical protein [Neospora caninum Liverpool]
MPLLWQVLSRETDPLSLAACARRSCVFFLTVFSSFSLFFSGFSCLSLVFRDASVPREARSSTADGRVDALPFGRTWKVGKSGDKVEEHSPQLSIPEEIKGNWSSSASGCVSCLHSSYPPDPYTADAPLALASISGRARSCLSSPASLQRSSLRASSLSLSSMAMSLPSSSSPSTLPPSPSSPPTERSEGDETSRPVSVRPRSVSPLLLPAAPAGGLWRYRRCPNPVSWISREAKSTRGIPRSSEPATPHRKEGGWHASVSPSGSFSALRSDKRKANPDDSQRKAVTRAKNGVTPQNPVCGVGSSCPSGDGLSPSRSPPCSAARSASGSLGPLISASTSLSCPSSAVDGAAFSSRLPERESRDRGNVLSQERGKGDELCACGKSSPTESVSDASAPSKQGTDAHFCYETHFPSLLEAKSESRAGASVAVRGRDCGKEKRECDQLGLPAGLDSGSPCECAACVSHPFSTCKTHAERSEREQEDCRGEREHEPEKKTTDDSSHYRKQEEVACAVIFERSHARVGSLTDCLPVQTDARERFLHEHAERMLEWKPSRGSERRSPLERQPGREKEVQSTSRRSSSALSPSLQISRGETQNAGKLRSLSDSQEMREMTETTARKNEEKVKNEDEDSGRAAWVHAGKCDVVDRNGIFRTRADKNQEDRDWRHGCHRKASGRQKYQTFPSRGSGSHREEGREGYSLSSKSFVPGRLRPQTREKAIPSSTLASWAPIAPCSSPSSSPPFPPSSCPSACSSLPSTLPSYSFLLPFVPPSSFPSARVPHSYPPSGETSQCHECEPKEGGREVIDCQLFLSATLPLPCTLLPEDVATSLGRAERKKQTGGDGTPKQAASPAVPASVALLDALKSSSPRAEEDEREQEAGPEETGGTRERDGGDLEEKEVASQENEGIAQTTEAGEKGGDSGPCEAHEQKERGKEGEGTNICERGVRETAERGGPKSKADPAKAAFACPRPQQKGDEGNGAVIMVQAVYDLTQEQLLLPAYHVYDKSGVFQGLLPYAAVMKAHSGSCLDPILSAKGHTAKERTEGEKQDKRETMRGMHSKTEVAEAGRCSGDNGAPTEDRGCRARASFNRSGPECGLSTSGRRVRRDEQSEREKGEAFPQRTVVTPLPVLPPRQLESLHSAVARMYGSGASNKGLLSVPRQQALSPSDRLPVCSPVSSPPICSPRGCPSRTSLSYSAAEGSRSPLLSSSSSPDSVSAVCSCSSPPEPSIASGPLRIRLRVARESGTRDSPLVEREKIGMASRWQTRDWTKKGDPEAEKRRQCEGAVEADEDAQRPVGSGRMRKRRRRRRESRAGEFGDQAEKARATTEGPREKAEKKAEESNGLPPPKRAELKALRGVFAALCYMATALRHEPAKDQKCQSDSACPSLLDSTQITGTNGGPVENVA